MNNIQVVASDVNEKALYISILNDYYHNEIFVKQSSGYYDEIKALIEYQYDNNCLNQIFFTYYVLSGYFFVIKDDHNSKYYLEKSIASCFGLNNSNQYFEFVSNLNNVLIKEVCPETLFTMDLTKLDKYKDL